MSNLQKQQILEALQSFIQSATQAADSLQTTINLLEQMGKVSSSSQISKIVITKIQMFVGNCQAQIKQITNNQNIQKYYQSLTFLKEKYNQLIKEAYRAANFESLQSQIQNQDVKKIKNQRKCKIQSIKRLEREMEDNWQSTFYDLKQNKKQQANMLQHGSITFDLYDHKQKKLRKVQMLGDITDISLEELAKNELQKQLLSMRITALNMYDRYRNHDHTNKVQKINFLKLQQENLSSQIKEMSETNFQMKKALQRLLKEYQQVQIINRLMSKRYHVKKSIETQQNN